MERQQKALYFFLQSFDETSIGHISYFRTKGLVPHDISSMSFCRFRKGFGTAVLCESCFLDTLVKKPFAYVRLCLHRFVRRSQNPTLLFASGTALCTGVQCLCPPPVPFCCTFLLSTLFVSSFPSGLLPHCCQASGWSFAQEKYKNRASFSWLYQELGFVPVIFFSSFWFDMVRSVSAEHRQLFVLPLYESLHISVLSRFVSPPFKRRTVSVCVLSRTSVSREQRSSCWCSSWKFGHSDSACLICSIELQKCWEVDGSHLCCWNWVAQGT